MLRNRLEIKQKCAESDGATPTITSSITAVSTSCSKLPSDNHGENYVRSSSIQQSNQLDETPCNFEDKDCQSDRYPTNNPHIEKTCRFKLQEKTDQELNTDKNCPEDCEDKHNDFDEKVCISCRGIDVEIDFHSDSKEYIYSSDNLYENEIGSLQLDYCFKIKAHEDYQFHVSNLKTNEETTYEKIIGEGSLFLEIPRIPFKHKYHFQNRREHISTTTEDTQILKTTTGDIFPDNEDFISVSSSKEELTSEYSELRSNKGDSCETIEISSQQDVTSVNSEVRSSKDLSCTSIEFTSKEKGDNDASEIISIFPLCGKLCSNCNRVIEEENIYFCLFGHDSCKVCKGKPCILCQRMMGEAKTYCKNHHKGCTIFSIPEHLIKHEIDCEFNDFRCPYPRCVFLNSLSDLKLHFLNSHSKNLIQSNNILEVLNGRKDRKWYLYCYDSLFVCWYYYYGTHIEFILQYIGANDSAKCYQFEVEIKTMTERKFSKKTVCAGWNDFSLCKGIYFDYEDLCNYDNSRFQFTANVRILNVNNGLYVSF